LTAPAPAPVRRGQPIWPVVGLIALYPLWWALGLGVLIFMIAAVPMTIILLRGMLTGRRLRLPPGFLWWVIFLAMVVVSVAGLNATPAGTAERTPDGRVTAVLFRAGAYAALTVLLIYVGNLTVEDLPQPRLVRLLAWLFLVTIAGGLLGVLAGRFSLTSPVELLLPPNIRELGFVQSLVHPSAAQVMNMGGGLHATRPAAPWGYTNTWGNNLCLLVVWFVVACWPLARHRRTRLLGAACLALAVVPVVHSLNRGLWIGLAVTGGYVAIRLARLGRVGAVSALAATAVAILIALHVTPLGTMVNQRMDNARSNGVRMFLVDRAMAGLAESPLIGFGSTRDTMGSRNSIAVGERQNCPRCGNFTVGGNGQLWQLLYAHGMIGAAAYIGFLLHGLWRFRRDRTAIGIAGSAALVGSFSSMLWYNSLVTPLALMFLGYALLWRNDQLQQNGLQQNGQARRGVAR
jgi:hypothetical protein